MNIVLVALYRYRNFSVRLLHSLLRNIEGIEPHAIFYKNCDTNIFSLPTTNEEKLFVELIVKLNPRLVGFSVLSPYAAIAKRLTRLVKDNSSSSVIWGGVHPTIFPEICIDEKGVDMLCMGEGEGALADLAKQLRDGKPHQFIENLWVKDSGRIIKNSLRPLVQDLDSLPFVSYGDNLHYFIDSNSITRKDPALLDNYFFIHSSRGCPYSCSYCVNSLLRPLFKNLGSYIRRRSVSSIIKEIKENSNLTKSKFEYGFFADEVFGSEESWLDEFELRYKEEIGLPFYVQYNPKIIDFAVLDKLTRAGLDTINFGIQTGSDFMRNAIFCRPGKNSEIINLVKKITSYNIKIVYDLIIDNPYDTEQTLKSTIEFLLQLPKPLFFNLYSLQYFPNYPLTKKAIKDGHIKQEEASVDNISLRATKNWAYVPKLLPYNKKQILQNIIWLIIENHTKNSIVIFSVFNDSWSSRLCLNYLNFKSIVLGKIFGLGGIVHRKRWMMHLMNGVKYALNGDLTTVYLKSKKHITNIIRR